MKKKVGVIIATALLTVGAVTAVYAKENYNSKNYGYTGTMMQQSNLNNVSYNKMIDIMRSNGFEAAANAMENRDYNAMSNFMNNLTDDQYNQMKNIMQNNGYGYMAKRMSSVNRQQMVNIHNTMMGN
ncbi:hypothetical protein [Candidatus Clostridium radicumherbarum]|uniref:Uncharacterized protein n=1 Tax=Candidatus Clostridium radicumherbarum TaxID=3381662 RepID=A0ABW8TLW8_9CLOT